MDTATGLGLTERIQVTVIAPNATASDGLATAVSVLGVKQGLALVDSLPRTSAYILTKKDGETRAVTSRRFQRWQADEP